VGTPGFDSTVFEDGAGGDGVRLFSEGFAFFFGSVFFFSWRFGFGFGFGIGFGGGGGSFSVASN
jgi:hypothetical protein